MRLIIVLFGILLTVTQVVGQEKTEYSSKNPILQKAHDRKIKAEEFSKTNKEHFLVKIYTTDKKAKVGKTHHWFFKLADTGMKPLNYAKIKVTGYLKSDPSVKFNYMEPVFPMCSEGKYIIGFAKVEHTGPWVLEASVQNFGTTDEITYEIELPSVNKHCQTGEQAKLISDF